MSITSGPVGLLAKVTATSQAGHRVHFDLRDGKTGSFSDPHSTYSVGDVVLISGDLDDADGDPVKIAKAPSSAWPDALWVGVVKLKLPDITIIDSGGRFRTVPTMTTPNYEIGNTVQAGDTQGVTRLLADEPIKYIDLPRVDESVIGRFLVRPDDSGPGFDDFGGLPAVVARARELIEVPLKNRKRLAAIGARPIKGVLFTGPPGTGKTMLARIIAVTCNAAFYEISGPAIFSKWFGQSEEVLRKLFGAAAKHDKAIIFFDEIDAVAGQRKDQSHEASKRVVAQLLTLMDGFTSDANVVVIAATNRPQDLDVALRRPGRFDWEIDFPYPGLDDRKDILTRTARGLRTKTPLPHSTIASRSSGWSAAELAQIWSEAALLAVADNRREIWAEDYIGGFERVARYRHLTKDDTTAGGDR